MFLFSVIFFFFKNLTVYEKMWENIVEPGRPQMTIRRMRIVCCVPKATNTHSGCVIRIAFSPRQWLYERASMLPYTYSARLVCTNRRECISEFE